MRYALVLVVLGGLGCSYSPGTFAYGTKTFAGRKVTVGCMDIAIDRREDRDGAAVLAYRFGNRCETRQLIDFTAVRVVGRDLVGNELGLMPFDPASQIRPLQIDARLAGGEVLAYPSEHELVQVCVDAASLVRATTPQWMCFAQPTPPPQDLPDDAIAPSERLAQTEAP